MKLLAHFWCHYDTFYTSSVCLFKKEMIDFYLSKTKKCVCVYKKAELMKVCIFWAPLVSTTIILSHCLTFKASVEKQRHIKHLALDHQTGCCLNFWYAAEELCKSRCLLRKPILHKHSKSFFIPVIDGFKLSLILNFLYNDIKKNN